MKNFILFTLSAIFLCACSSVKPPAKPTGALEPVNKTLIGSYPDEKK